MAAPRLTSQVAQQFFEECFRLTPFNVEQIITGSGSEFKGDFDRMISDLQIVHLWTYPNIPKMNAVCERFNRNTRAICDFHEDLIVYRFLLLQNRHTTAMDDGSADNAGAVICPYILYITDLNLFNEKLADCLVKYNTLRPHKGLALKTPIQYILESNKKCNMGWTHTVSRLDSSIMLSFSQWRTSLVV